MDKMILNETPVRTAVNFNINNVKLDNLNIKNKANEFNNIGIKYDDSKIKIEKNTDDFDLNYGISKEFTNAVKNNSNSNMKILINDNLDSNLNVDFKFDSKNNTLINNFSIIAKENKSATIVLRYETKDDSECINNQVLRIALERNSNINIVLLNFMNLNSNNFIAIDSKIADEAKLNFTIVDFGCKNSITNYYSNLIGKNSENFLNTIYLGSKEQFFDLNYISHLRGNNSNVDIEVQGALKDKSRKHFKGTIDFKKGAKKSCGNENEACILLSGKAKGISLPMLLCSEEDVKGNHSSSAGKIDERQLFYIMSRGFSKKEAMKLIVRAKFNKIIDTINNEEIKKEVLRKIDEKLD